MLGRAMYQGLHRVVIREVFSTTSLPRVGTVVFLAISQLADVDHPVLASRFGEFALVRRVREEPMELLAVIRVDASLLAKLSLGADRRGRHDRSNGSGQRLPGAKKGAVAAE